MVQTAAEAVKVVARIDKIAKKKSEESRKAKPAASPKKRAPLKPRPLKKNESHWHPSYETMVNRAILGLNERGGSSAIAIEKYLINHFRVPDTVRGHLHLAIKRLLAAGKLIQDGHSYRLSPNVRAKVKGKKKSASASKKRTADGEAKPSPVKAAAAAKKAQAGKETGAAAEKPKKKKAAAKKAAAAKPKLAKAKGAATAAAKKSKAGAKPKKAAAAKPKKAAAAAKPKKAAAAAK